MLQLARVSICFGRVLRVAANELDLISSELRLEQVLARFYGDQLYRDGLTVRTTLDGRLQRAMSSLKGQELDRVTVVKDGREVLAIACTGDAEAVRSAIGANWNPENAPEAVVISPEEIGKEDILVSAPAVSAESVPSSAATGTTQGKTEELSRH